MRRRVERGGDAGPALVGLRRPTAIGPRLRDACHLGRLGYPRSVTLDDDVGITDRQRERTPRTRATLRAFRVPVPVWNQNAPSSQIAPTAVTCGLPSPLRVVSHFVRALCASGSGADPASSFSATVAQSTGGSPSASPRLMISICVSLRRACQLPMQSQVGRCRVGRLIAAEALVGVDPNRNYQTRNKT